MSENLYLVLSRPPDGLSADEYDHWYDLHVRENEVPRVGDRAEDALDPLVSRPLQVREVHRVVDVLVGVDVLGLHGELNDVRRGVIELHDCARLPQRLALHCAIADVAPVLHTGPVDRVRQRIGCTLRFTDADQRRSRVVRGRARCQRR